MRLSNARIGIGIPLSFHMVPSAFFDSFISMDKPDYAYFRTNTGPIETMRNNLVADALRSGCTHLFMLDTDQQYPADTLMRLLSHKKLAVGARIRRRYPPFDNLMFRGTVGAYEPIQGWTPGDLLEVDATGTGCMLFDTTVFKRLRAPWFETRTHNNKPVGEDFVFCSKLRALGIPIYVDTGLYVPHLTQFGITDTFANVYEKLAATVAAQEAHAA